MVVCTILINGVVDTVAHNQEGAAYSLIGMSQHGQSSIQHDQKLFTIQPENTHTRYTMFVLLLKHVVYTIYSPPLVQYCFMCIATLYTNVWLH